MLSNSLCIIENMNGSKNLQFFVLDVSVIILAVLVIILGVAVFVLYRKSRAQQIYNAKMEKTIDRILRIDAGAGGGIDGWEMAHQERKGKAARDKSNHHPIH
jgi:hypothetical protein